MMVTMNVIVAYDALGLLTALCACCHAFIALCEICHIERGQIHQ